MSRPTLTTTAKICYWWDIIKYQVVQYVGWLFGQQQGGCLHQPFQNIIFVFFRQWQTFVLELLPNPVVPTQTEIKQPESQKLQISQTRPYSRCRNTKQKIVINVKCDSRCTLVLLFPCLRASQPSTVCSRQSRRRGSDEMGLERSWVLTGTYPSPTYTTCTTLHQIWTSVSQHFLPWSLFTQICYLEDFSRYHVLLHKRIWT